MFLFSYIGLGGILSRISSKMSEAKLLHGMYQLLGAINSQFFGSDSDPPNAPVDNKPPWIVVER